MNREEVLEFMNEIDISVVAFPKESNGVVAFEPLRKITTMEGKINFSALITIEYKKELTYELTLNLLKLVSNTESQVKAFKLGKIRFNDQNQLISDDEVLKSDTSNNAKLIDVKPYEHTKTIRYNFNNVPLDGSGVYYLSVGIDDGDNFFSLKSVPIEVTSI
ncbi:MAG: hypothetical protein Q4E64_05520 [Phascolarctobacterium sp.]|nr:hypothetical protein [Phascolarctobacterium sp.]